MTQDRINRFFLSSLGEQCVELFSTSDNQVFIRKEEADTHASLLEDKTVLTWYDTNDEEMFPEEIL